MHELLVSPYSCWGHETPPKEETLKKQKHHWLSLTTMHLFTVHKRSLEFLKMQFICSDSADTLTFLSQEWIDKQTWKLLAKKRPMANLQQNLQLQGTSEVKYSQRVSTRFHSSNFFFKLQIKKAGWEMQKSYKILTWF